LRFVEGWLIGRLRAELRPRNWGRRGWWAAVGGPGEGSCTRREWTFCQNDWSAVPALEVVVVDTGMIFETGTGAGRGSVIADMALAVSLLSFETLIGLEIVDPVAGKKIIAQNWRKKTKVGHRKIGDIDAAVAAHFEAKVEFQKDWSNWLEPVKELIEAAPGLPHKQMVD